MTSQVRLVAEVVVKGIVLCCGGYIQQSRGAAGLCAFVGNVCIAVDVLYGGIVLW
jgi:hypothetical protein